MTEVEILIQALKNKEKLVAMLAPSFPIMFDYPQIITMLRKLGFSYVVEVAAGARKTNEELKKVIEANPEKKYITTPCPTIIRMIKKQFPHLVKYFPPNVDSPMAATAKIVAEKYPGYRPVFIGPCIVKKLEASEDRPELNILVITYAELLEIFKQFNIQPVNNPDDKFDIEESGLPRIYSIDGGLSHSGGLTLLFKKNEIKIVSNWKNCIEVLKNFENDRTVKLLDILFCDGGCIGGPGIKSDLTREEREKKILDYWEKNQR
ncbi:MAG: [Fe-Fe] hydrogenase large subunit C-terminal domain-containing protein [Microgenomates group bacterium]|nr:[Fe-Fe] hydrogenase large subunit C-terminal domain-containing protein [Microgenomates group bacterium]